MTRYFYSADGQAYLGGFEGDDALTLVPNDAHEVPNPPPHGLDTLNTNTGEFIPFVEPATLEKRLDNIFSGLPVSVRAQFLPLKAAIKLALDQGDIEVARYVIQTTVVPDYLVQAQQAMLEEF